MREGDIISFDDTRIRYRVHGEGDRPWVVIANGYGGTFTAWDDLMPRLEARFRVLIWDYRGTYASAVPRDPDALKIDDHVRDLEVLRSLLGIDRAVLVGWSVGVQVALAVYRRDPDFVDGLALVAGAHDRILKRVLGGGLKRHAVGPAVRAVRNLAPLISPPLRPLLRRATRSRLFPAAFERLGLVTGQPETFSQSVQAMMEIDFRAYLHMATLADRHETESWLHTVDVPTLVVTGARDAVTPPRVIQPMVDRIPDCRHLELAEGTHYLLMEFPDRLADALLDFTDAAM